MRALSLHPSACKSGTGPRGARRARRPREVHL